MAKRVRPAWLVALFFVINWLMTVAHGGAIPQRGPQPIESPVLGFVYSETSHDIRAILGIPGAAVLSDSLPLPSEVSKVHFAPGQDYAIVERDGATSLAVMKLNAANFGSLVEIPSAISTAGILTFSPSANSAAIYSESAGLEVITGLPDTPRVSRHIATLDVVDPVAAVAAADDGHMLMLATIHGRIYRLLDGAEPEFVDSIDNFAGIVLAPGSNSALVISHHGRAISIQDLRGVPSRVVLSDLPELEGDIRLAIDQGSALIASSTSNHIWKVDLTSFQVSEVNVLFSPPSMLQPLRSWRRFLVNYGQESPTWILDTNGPDPAVFFVPAAPN